MALRNFARAIILHLSHEEKVEFGAGIQPVPDDLAEHWHVLANSEAVGEHTEANGKQLVEVVIDGDYADALVAVTGERDTALAHIAGLEANAAEFEARFVAVAAERDAAVAEVERLTAALAAAVAAPEDVEGSAEGDAPPPAAPEGEAAPAAKTRTRRN